MGSPVRLSEITRRGSVALLGGGQHRDHVAMFPQVFYTQSLRCVVEDEPPVSSTLPVLLTSRACWAPDETARLMVMHRNSDNMRLAITTYELGTKQSQKGVDAVGKGPRSRPVTIALWCFQYRVLRFPLGHFSSLPTSVLFVIICTGRMVECLPCAGSSVWPWDPDTNHWPHTASPLLSVLSQLWQTHSS